MRQLFTSLFSLIIIGMNAQNNMEVYFDYNSSALTSQTKLTLSKLDLTKIDVLGIYGYTDTIGSVAFNTTLAGQRVKAVCGYLKVKNPISNEKANIGELFDYAPLDKDNRKVVIQTKAKTVEAKSFEDNLKNAKIGDVIVMKSLNYEPGLAILLPESAPLLDELYNQMAQNKKLVIQIQGHICCADNDSTNLSRARAKLVYDFLIQKGITKSRMSYRGFGVAKPFYPIPENNDEERIANRRVEIKIVSNK
jgi:outer membrane protein OmpA-like peptidoglycan-associated protein